MWISTSWKTTLSNVKLLPDTSAPFSSITLPMRPFLKVELSPLLWNVSAFVKAPSTSNPSNTTFEAPLSSWRSFGSPVPLKTTAFDPPGIVCDGYEPAATPTTSPAAATA